MANICYAMRVGLAIFTMISPALVSLPAAADSAVVRWEAPVEVATGDAFRGPWRMNDSRFLFVDDPSVAMDDEGGVMVVWADQAAQDIFLQRHDAYGQPRFDQPVNISNSAGTFSWLPRLVAAGDRVFVLWQEIVFSGGSHGGEIHFARSGDGGRSFSPPLNLSRTPAGAGKGRLNRNYWHNGSLDLLRSPDGRLYAAWTEYEGPLRFSYSTDNGDSFSEPVLVAGGDDDLPARGPVLALDSGGVVYLAWTAGEDPAADVRLSRSVDHGTSFEPPVAVARSDGHADAPALAVVGDALHVVWGESRDGPLRSYRLRYARAPLDGEHLEFETPRTIETGDAAVSAAFPHLGTDAAGTLFLLWESFPQRVDRPRGLGYALSTDGGRSFSAPSVVPGTDDPGLGINGSQQGLLMRKLAVGSDGHIAVVNSSFARGQASRIRLYQARYLAE